MLDDLWSNFSFYGEPVGFSEPTYTLGFDGTLQDWGMTTPYVDYGMDYSFYGEPLTTAQLMQETMPGGIQEGQMYDLGGPGGRYDISLGEVNALGEPTPGAERFPGFNRDELSYGSLPSLRLPSLGGMGSGGGMGGGLSSLGQVNVTPPGTVSNVPPSPIPLSPPVQSGFTPIAAPPIPDYDKARGLDRLLMERR
jgi:hypothetical protein